MKILADLRSNHRKIKNPEGQWTPCIELVLIIVEKHYELTEGEASAPMLRTTYKTESIRFELLPDGATALHRALTEFLETETNTT